MRTTSKFLEGNISGVFFGVGVENAKLLTFSVGRPFFLHQHILDNFKVSADICGVVELGLSSETVSLAECVLVKKVKTN